MKKLIALFLATLMVLSLCAVVSVAEESENVAPKAAYEVHDFYQQQKSSPWGWSDDPADTVYGDETGKDLIDGKHATAEDGTPDAGYGNAAWVGMSMKHPNAEANGQYIVFKLDKVYDVGTIVITVSNLCASGIAAPASITAYHSDNGTDYKGGVAGAYTAELVEGTVATYKIELNQKTQYIKLDYVNAEKNTWMFTDEVEIYTKAASAPTIELKDFFVSHYNDTSAEGAGVIFTEAYSGAAWWCHVSFKPVEGKAGVYEVVEIANGLADGSGVPLAIPEGGFVYGVNSGNNWGDLVDQHTAAGTLEEQWWYASYQADPEYYTTNFAKNAAVLASIEIANSMTVGSKWYFQGVDLEGKTVPTSTPDKKWYTEGYVCTAKIGAYVDGAVLPGEEGGSTAPVKETITVDGELNDTGWNASKWTSVKPGESGTWQALPAEGVTNTIEYKYQIRKDDSKLYIATIYDGPATKVAAGSTNANGNGTNFRFWIHNGDPEATVYTHFIDACLCVDGTTGFRFMMNTEKNANKAAAGTTESLKAVVVEKDGKTYCEISIDLADLGIPEGKTASIVPCISSTPTGSLDDNLCLFAGVIPYGDTEAGENFLKNMPYSNFYFETADAVTEDIALGEITAPQPDTGDSGIVALAILAIVALFGSAIVVKTRR